ncbi:hypothetical protein [Saccharopolyspora gregorii]|uniref:Uncharacterized protein n=1 Tax=Saccharopolyspora gregorii TaxID=33914 RepID=A0ABP6RMU3_9PSEU
MSSTTNPEALTGSRLARIATACFAVAVVVFLLGGLAVVLGQSAVLAAGDATAARNWADALAPVSFGGASVAGLLSFALTYRRDGEDDSG